MDSAVVKVQGLKMYYPVLRGILRKKVSEIKAVDGVSFEIRRGETLGLVGESGCGKTTVGRCILRVHEPTAGSIVFQGQDVTHLSERKIRPLRRKMGSVFQDPYGSLNPRQTVGSIVGEPLKIHHLVRSRTEYEEKVAELFELVRLNPEWADRVPHEFSGGQRQRVAIARALACGPDLVVCDEAISALDVSIQAQIINLLEELQEELGLSYLFIAHDLAVVRHISDRIAVLYLGRLVEVTSSDELYENPLHPYTQALLSAVPIPDPVVEESRQLGLLGGEAPSMLHPPSGCSFHPRCPRATPECAQVTPELSELAPDHLVACLHVDAGGVA